MWRSASLLALAMAAACTARAPHVAVDPPVDVEAFLTAHPPAPGQAIRVDEVGRTTSASYHVVQVQGRERPHLHTAHDLTVVVLRGRGTLTRGDARVPMSAGDAAVIPRGVVHWFAREGGSPAVAFVMFSPPLDAPDTVPVPGAE